LAVPHSGSIPSGDAETKSSRRRMRRSSRPTGSPRARSSRSSRAKSASSTTSTTQNIKIKSHDNQKSQPKTKRPKSIPFQPLPEFANLTPDHVDFLHDYIRHHTYEQSISLLRSTLNIEISLNRLYRYRSRLDLAEQLHITNDNAPAIENLLGLLAGRSVDIDAAGLALVKQRALALAARPDTAPSLLMNLLRIFTWEHRKTLNEHRMQSIDRRDKCRERMTKVAEKRQKLAEKKCNQARDNDEATLQEKENAMLELFGDFPPMRPFSGTPQDPASATTSLTSLKNPSQMPPIQPAIRPRLVKFLN
jgi:hypothetical protein